MDKVQVSWQKYSGENDGLEITANVYDAEDVNEFQCKGNDLSTCFSLDGPRIYYSTELTFNFLFTESEASLDTGANPARTFGYQMLLFYCATIETCESLQFDVEIYTITKTTDCTSPVFDSV